MALTLASAMLAHPVWAQNELNAPVLRIEPGMHAAAINDAAMDQSGALIVTVSNDKTARAWTLPELRPLRVLRPSIGPDQQGQLYAVVVSPDGAVAAVGGWLGRTTNLTVIDLFELASGKVVHQFKAEGLVQALAISKDGPLLAAGLSAGGVRVWRLADWASELKDRDYTDGVYGLDFAPDGRLAASSFDGALRLYDARMKLIERRATGAGQCPFRLRFSPDGRELAVGFDDKAAVEVRSGNDLALLASPDLSGLSAKDLRRVAWSTDGQELFAGAVLLDGDTPLIGWGKRGAGRRRVVASGFHDRISSILPLGRDTLAVTSMDPAISVLAGGQRRASQTSPIADLKPLSGDDDLARQLFSVSYDGSVIEMAGRDNYRRPLHIDTSALSDPELLLVTQLEAKTPGLTDWQAAEGALQAQGWFNETNPRLNGHALALDPHEIAHAIDVRHSRVLLGAGRSLRLSSADGTELWPRLVPLSDGAWRVVQSPDGRLAIAALGDGTVRWFRASDGTELLTFFLHSDGKRWVAFTPGGYYAASLGGEDLIGWQINNRQDQAADFFPASRFRARFYRPDVVELVLRTLDEAQAVQQADATHAGTSRSVLSRGALKQEVMDGRPPIVTILSPRDGAQLDGDSAELDMEVRSPNARPIRLVEVRLDGRPAPGAQIPNLKTTDPAKGDSVQRLRLVVPVPAGQPVTLQVIAWSEDTASEAASVTVHGRGRPDDAQMNKPRLNALLVGVSNYSNQDLRLQFAARDANDLRDALKKQEGGLYGEVDPQLLVDKAATREAILEKLLWLEKSTTERDLAVIFLAGHGDAPEEDEYYFLPFEADEESIVTKGLSGTALLRELRRIPARTVVFLDTCYAGALGSGTRAVQPDINKLINEMLAAEIGVAVFSGTGARQRAQERPDLNHGIFTYAILNALDGAAGKPPDDTLRFHVLETELTEEVRKKTDKQHPTSYYIKSLSDAPLFLIRP